ncbi:MAG: hypothetical protein ACKVH0_21305, partial [Alphaproteobacteria bacterium]
MLNRFPIRFKLPLIVGLIGILSAGIVGITSYVSSSVSIRDSAETRINAAAEARASVLSNWLNAIHADLVEWAKYDETHQALADFTSGWNSIGGNETEALQDGYIKKNRYPTGEKQRLASSGSQPFPVVHQTDTKSAPGV